MQRLVRLATGSGFSKAELNRVRVKAELEKHFTSPGYFKLTMPSSINGSPPLRLLTVLAAFYGKKIVTANPSNDSTTVLLLTGHQPFPPPPLLLLPV